MKFRMGSDEVEGSTVVLYCFGATLRREASWQLHWALHSHAGLGSQRLRLDLPLVHVRAQC